MTNEEQRALDKETIEHQQDVIASLHTQLDRALEALAHSDPWLVGNVGERVTFICRHCKHEYSPTATSEAWQHEPGCVYLAARIATGETALAVFDGRKSA